MDDRQNEIFKRSAFVLLTIAKMGKGTKSPETAILGALESAHAEGWGLVALRELSGRLLQTSGELFNAEICKGLRLPVRRYFAELIVSQAEEKGLIKFNRIVSQELPLQLQKRPKDEQTDYLRSKVAELRTWQRDPKEYKLPFDVERNDRQQLVGWLKQLMIDKDDGLPVPFNNDAHAVLMLAERFFVAQYIRYLVDLIDNTKPHQVRQQVQPDDILNDHFAELIRQVLEARGLLQDGKFIGKTTHVKALFAVLRPKLSRLTYAEKWFSEFFLHHFGFYITGRTLQNPPNKGQETEEKLLKDLIGKLS
jgi:hypothetical protein